MTDAVSALSNGFAYDLVLVTVLLAIAGTGSSAYFRLRTEIGATIPYRFHRDHYVAGIFSILFCASYLASLYLQILSVDAILNRWTNNWLPRVPALYHVVVTKQDLFSYIGLSKVYHLHAVSWFGFAMLLQSVTYLLWSLVDFPRKYAEAASIQKRLQKIVEEIK